MDSSEASTPKGTLNGQASQVATSPAKEQLRHARDLSEAFKSAAKRVGPSVVFINTVDRNDDQVGLADDFLSRGPRRGIPERQGAGTGVIISPRGHIVTNNHVIDGAGQIRVRLADGRELVAQPVGVDPDTDLAVIKVDAEALEPAVFGDSEILEVGEWVLAVGNPFGLEQTVTAGIVSAKGRSGMRLATYENYIQTDAAINPGNSGGPLVNLDGEVVGINSAITTRSGGSLGIGFAIPSAMVRAVAESLSTAGAAGRGRPGVGVRPIAPDEAAEDGPGGVEVGSGVVVDAVVADGPAHRAGVRPGDVLLRIDGRAMTAPLLFTRTMGDLKPEAKLQIDLLRDGDSLRLEARLGGRPSDLRHEIITGREMQQLLGLRLGRLTEHVAALIGVKPGAGLVIREIAGRSPAARWGLRRGDVIRRINRIQPTVVEEFERELSESFGRRMRSVELEVDRQGDLEVLRFSLR